MALDSPSPLLVIPTDRPDRWKLVRTIIKQWFPADRRQLGLPAGMGPITLPPTACAAIQEWHAIAREAPGIWCQQDHLFGAGGDWRQGDYLAIAVENQGCVAWGVLRSDLEQDDPPVFLHLGEIGDEWWVLESSTVSEFALAWLAYSIKWSDHLGGWVNGSVNKATVQIVTEQVPRLGLPDWHGPAFPTRFYGTNDLIVEVQLDKDNLWLSAAARTKAAFAEFKRLIAPAQAQWSASSDEWPDGWVSSPDADAAN
jgi:hypothetical protein